MLRSIGSVTFLALLMVGCGGGDGGSGGGGSLNTYSIGGTVTGLTGSGLVLQTNAGDVASVSKAGAFSFPNALGSGAAYTVTVKTQPSTPAQNCVVTNGSGTVGTANITDVAVACSVGPMIKITSGAPPPGVHGTAYGFAFTATGGSLPLGWTVTAGTLPPGLSLNPDGTLSGTPTTVSSTPYAFTVTVTDSSTPKPATNSVAYAITVSEPVPLTIINTPPPTATVGSPYSFTFSANDGLAPLIWTPPTTPMGGLTFSLDGVLSGTPSTAGIFPITLTVKDALNQRSPATPFTVRIALARPAAAFIQTGSMAIARTGHTATLLQNGQVLIAGGGNHSSTLASAELYDPTSHAFTATGSMTVARRAHSATLLANSTLPNYGKVLVAGGGSRIAELYDPTTYNFTATGSMVAPHLGQTATLLKNGQVLIAGGETASAELFSPSTGTFTATGGMAVSRSGHTATLLPDGRVLIAGGVQDVGPGTVPIPPGPGVASAEIYDPVSGTFISTGSMSEGRSGHTATMLVDGTVLLTGTDSTAELFNPGTGTFSVVGELSTGGGSTATLRKDGTVLVAGGRSGGSLATAMLFAPESGGFVATGSLITARDGHTATRLVDGTVLITGGINYVFQCGRGGCHSSSPVLLSAELFQ